MTKEQSFNRYLKEVEQDFSGWDFSYVTDTGRMDSSLLSWSYGSIAKRLITEAASLLDMGTGGGELLAKLQPFPQSVFATEGYKPNFPIAKKRLEPLGVTVVEIEEDNLLPFHNGQFDLIINKHEAYSASEVRRTISDRGIFLTQQVGGADCAEINEALGVPLNDEYLYWQVDFAKRELEENGFRVTFSKEEAPIQRFYDVGALVYYLKAIPWQIPDFEVVNYMEKLYSIHRKIESKGYFDVTQQRFIIKAEAI
jgi:SAM-dependent methyltransferase